MAKKTPIGKENARVTQFIAEVAEPAIKKIVEGVNVLMMKKFKIRVGAEVQWFYEYDTDEDQEN